MAKNEDSVRNGAAVAATIYSTNAHPIDILQECTVSLGKDNTHIWYTYGENMTREPTMKNRRKRPANTSPRVGAFEDAADVLRAGALFIGTIDFRPPNIVEEGVACLFPWGY